MTPITLNPEQILCYGGLTVLGIGVLMLIGFFYWLKGDVANRRGSTWLKVLGWSGLVVVVLGGIVAFHGFAVVSNRIWAEKIATLPIEWQEFHAELGNLDASLMREAIERFAKTRPPMITPEQYAILVSGSTFIGQSNRDRSFNDYHIKARVSLPFAERKE